MAFYSYTLKDFEKWDKIVKNFEKYDVYYLSGYVNAFKIHGDGEPLLLYYEGNGLKAINVVMLRDIANDHYFKGKIPNNCYFDLITPYGYGGWLIEGEGETRDLFAQYEQWCVNNNVVSEFVRFHPIIKNSKKVSDFYQVIDLGSTIYMDLSTPEIIWQNLSSKNRNVIRKAINSEVKIHSGQYTEIYDTFMSIYNATMDDDNASPYYYFSRDFYDSILNDLTQNSRVFWAELNNEIIAVSIMIFANGYMNYHLSGSKREYRSYAPSNLLLYEAAVWGYENGYKTFHLGGGVGSNEDNLYKFKSAFNKYGIETFSIGKKVFLKDVYEKLCSMKPSIVNKNYFPSYRA